MNPDWIAQRAGEAAEVFHGGTFNVDAARRGRVDLRAEIGPRNYQTVDLRVVDTRTGETVRTAQSKYCGDARQTGGAINNPKYNGVDEKIVPADQLGEVRRNARKNAGAPCGGLFQKAAEVPHQVVQVLGAAPRLLAPQQRLRLLPEGREVWGLTPAPRRQAGRSAARPRTAPGWPPAPRPGPRCG